jgi:2-keto-4-pentenoate hydratase/2-oxohepta-3-ene-1,7-dioic acid hydratase in catechol pathway
MRLVTYRQTAEPRIGAMVGGGIVDLRDAMAGLLAQAGSGDPVGEAACRVPGDMTLLLSRAGTELAPFAEAVAAPTAPKPLAPSAVTLLAPVPRPGKIVGVGRNYGAHAAEGALERQEEPRLFTKFSSSVIGPGAAIVRPQGIVQLDWEVELAIVVGRRMKDVARENALSFVAGYTILNDISAREFQFDVKPPQTTFAKSHDTFTPMGPELVTADAFGDPGNVDVSCHVNGVEMQAGNTHDMIFDCAYILSYISRFATLEPGDVVATGTPTGVGHFRKPPVYLKPGDRVTCRVAGIGTLDNPVA